MSVALQACVRLPPQGCSRGGRRRPVLPAALFHEEPSSSNGAGGAQQHAAPPHPSLQHPLFPEAQAASAVPVPVQTQRGVPTFKPAIPDRPCPVCGGTGKTTCGDCRGKGRLNYRGAAMLPQGVKPQWCPSCRASGRWCCAQCMGTGVRRAPMGFRLPHELDDADGAP